ncbi:MAG: energy transducer TonB [Candidatus Obscuribacterales bacterium]|nr:energy transducer TonB [Candidatus Obscuribacterales bacterium]
MSNRFFLTVVLTSQIMVAGATGLAFAEDHVDTDNEPNHLMEPSAELKDWCSLAEARLSKTMKKESRLTSEIKIPVVCIFNVEATGSITNLTFKNTSGSQENDSCALEVVKKAAPFEALPPNLRTPQRIAVRIGQNGIKIWQMP